MTDELSLKLVEPEIAPTYSILCFKSYELPQEYSAFIYSKWLRSLKYGNPIFRPIAQTVYYAHYRIFLESLMAKPDSITRLAVLSDDHDVALGFSVSREDVLDYLYVKRDLRRLGIAKVLLSKMEKFTTFTHVTATTMDIWRHNKKYKHLEFNPFA